MKKTGQGKPPSARLMWQTQVLFVTKVTRGGSEGRGGGSEGVAHWHLAPQRDIFFFFAITPLCGRWQVLIIVCIFCVFSTTITRIPS